MASIVIPNWDGKKYLRDWDCLEPIRAQTYKDFEVLWVDKASSDSSIESVKTFFAEPQVIAWSQNQGFSGAANAGIKRAKGEFVSLLNNDAFPGENWLKALVEGIQETPDIGICASKIFRMTEEMRIQTAGDGYTRVGVAFMAMRKPLLGKLGDFDENYFIYYLLDSQSILWRQPELVQSPPHLQPEFFSVERPFDLRQTNRGEIFYIFPELPFSLPVWFEAKLPPDAYHIFGRDSAALVKSLRSPHKC